MNVVFFIDHKYRDFFSMAQIAYKLDKKINNIFFLPNSKYKFLQYFDYAIILKPQLPLAIQNQYNLGKLKTKIIIIESEGLNQDLEFEINPGLIPDLWLFWNEYEKKKYEHLKSKKNILLHSIGNPRLELLKNRYYQELLVNLYGEFKSEYKIITISSSLHECFFDKEEINQKRIRRQRQFKKSMNYDLYISNSHLLLELITSALKDLIKKYENFIFILKPHPNEKIQYWIDLKSNLNSNNLILFSKGNIINLLKNSSLHIALNGCTTTLEAKLMYIPTLELHTKYSKDLYHKDHLNLPDYKALNKTDVLNTVNLLKENKIKINKMDEDYVNKYLFNFDKNTIYEYAKVLTDFIYSHKYKRNLFSSLFLNLFIRFDYFIEYFYLLKNRFINNKKNLNYKYDHRILFNEHLKLNKIFKGKI